MEILLVFASAVLSWVVFMEIGCQIGERAAADFYKKEIDKIIKK